jgi:predicted short-subunit dehydrogenase-like oxidoreductase (DUF2520 family)
LAQIIRRLAEARGIAAASPRDVAEKAEILITSLPNVDPFDQVMTGQGGIASSNGKGQIVIECSTLLRVALGRDPAGIEGALQASADRPQISSLLRGARGAKFLNCGAPVETGKE